MLSDINEYGQPNLFTLFRASLNEIVLNRMAERTHALKMYEKHCASALLKRLFPDELVNLQSTLLPYLEVKLLRTTEEEDCFLSAWR